jgi:hypothetical protein
MSLWLVFGFRQLATEVFRMNRHFSLWLALLLAAAPLTLFGQNFGAVENAEWVALGRNENFRAYLDQRSVQRNGDLARAYQLTDFVAAQWIDGNTVIGSILSLVEYDCTRPRARTLATEAYSEQMGKGNLIANERNPDAEWGNTTPGGSAESAWRLVCGK